MKAARGLVWSKLHPSYSFAPKRQLPIWTDSFVAYISLHIPSHIHRVPNTSTYSGMPFSSDSTCYMRSRERLRKIIISQIFKGALDPFLSKESQILKEPVSTPIGVNERIYTVYNSHCSVLATLSVAAWLPHLPSMPAEHTSLHPSNSYQ